MADVIVTHPAPYTDWHRDFLVPLRAADYPGEIGIRIGILCRPARAEAWRVAREQFPPSWVGQQETLLKTRSPNVWSRELAIRAVEREAETAACDGGSDPYWLGAFHSGLASAPFLVGTYSDVAECLARYVAAGVGHIILTGSRDDELTHIQHGIRLATGA
jgi:alkanesulfonate monooxygenase